MLEQSPWNFYWINIKLQNSKLQPEKQILFFNALGVWQLYLVSLFK